MSDKASTARDGVALDETIHQPTRLRIMTLLVSVPEPDRLAYGFIQQTLGLTGGNQTVHLRKLEAAGFLVITKEFEGSKPRTWLQATRAGRRAYTEYLSNLEQALGLRVHDRAHDDGQPGRQPT
ncbi:MAG: helix-turn-helix domain-containing protein [Acidimicrobiaceae bacterium]|nr:helix-turn-helix domain-containing protein [Acidimicrobiaceae bacterium]MYI15415.1 helix-turn-helix domain-containing protein [Acidimicrobiaceae bacterium]